MIKYQPLIRYTGNKRKIFEIIRDCDYSLYVESFCGGCSLLPYRKSEKAYCFDIVPELIELWNVLKNKSIEEVIDNYRENVILFKENSDYYYTVRKRFNENKNPLDFFFLTRASANGLIRFNSKGEFNAPADFRQREIKPENLRKIFETWKPILQNAEFINKDFRESLEFANKDVLYFLDPPYENMANSLYSLGKYSYNKDMLFEFLEELNRKNAKYVLTYDGISGNNDNTIYELPKELYKHKFLIKNGNSGFNNLNKKNNVKLYETVYKNYG